MKKKILSITLSLILSITTILSLSYSFTHSTYAEAYPCSSYSGHNHCFTFNVTSECTADNKPQVKFTWENKWGDKSFNIVYTHNGHWYQFHVGNVTSATIPPNVGNDGDAGKDTAPLQVGQTITGKITGGVPKSEGGGGITTGYTPDDSAPLNDCSPQPTATATPSGPTATPTPGPHTNAKVVLLLPAVGGKNGGNPNPGRPTRNVTLYFYQADQDPSDPSITPIKRTGTVHLDSTTGSGTYGYFTNGTLDVGGLNGTYKVLVKSNQYLRKQFVPKDGDSSQTYVFTPGQTTVLPTITLLAGDIVPPPTTAGGDYGDNTIDISDYNMLARGCYGGKATTSSCANKEGADLNDDGKVDGIDYNILIRTFNILVNEGTQGGDGE